MTKTIFPLISLLSAFQGALAEDVKTVTLSEAFLPSQAKLSDEYVVHLPFSVPGNFIKRDVPQEGVVLWGTPDQKDEAQGFPSATVTAISNNRHHFLQYVALGEPALLVNYYYVEPYSD